MLVPREKTCFVQGHTMTGQLAQGLFHYSSSAQQSPPDQGCNCGFCQLIWHKMFDKITFVTQPFSQDGSGTVLGIGNEGVKVTRSHHWETQSNANEIRRVWKSTEQSWAGKGFPEEVTPKLRPEGWVEVGEAQNGKKSVLEECSVRKDCSAKVSREEGAASVSWACMNAGFKDKGAGWHEIGEVKYIPWSEHKGPCELSYKFTCITFHECPLPDDNRKPWKVSQNWYRKIPSIGPGQSKATINSCWWV